MRAGAWQAPQTGLSSHCARHDSPATVYRVGRSQRPAPETVDRGGALASIGLYQASLTEQHANRDRLA